MHTDTVRRGFKNSVRGVSSSQFELTQGLEKQEVPVWHARALWNTKALFQSLIFDLSAFPSPQLCLENSPQFLQNKGKHSTSGYLADGPEAPTSSFNHENWRCFEGQTTLPSWNSAEEQNSEWRTGNYEGVNCCSASRKRNTLPGRHGLHRMDGSVSMLHLMLIYSMTL